jgi:hypothetical protein
MLLIMSLNFTDQGIRNIKDAPKRAQAARDLAKTCGCEIKQVYLTSGESDLMVFVETASGDNRPSSRWRKVQPAMCAAAPHEDRLRTAVASRGAR